MTTIDSARQIIASVGFVADGSTAEERVRVSTARSPVLGGIGGEARTFGGRERYRLDGTPIRVTLGARTVYLYRLDGGGKISTLGQWPTRELTETALRTAVGQ